MNAPAQATSSILEDHNLLREVEAFLVLEARLLDERRFEEWIELFADDGYYWVPGDPGQVDPYAEVSVFFDDRTLMKERIARLRHPRAHSQIPASRTSHIVANVSLETPKGAATGVADVLVRSKFLMCEYRPSLPEGLKRFFSGTSWHSLVRSGEIFRIRWKKVELVDCDAAFEPLSIYF